MVFHGKKLFWILPCFLLLREASPSKTEEEKALAEMKLHWEECCRSNKTLCIRGSCYSMEWRAAAWTAVRNRCRGRYSDWPFAVDIMKVRDDKDIDALWKLLSMANAYPNENSALPVTVWTSGTRCPQRGPSGIVVSTKWASKQPFPSWLEQQVNGASPMNDTSFDDVCKFMVITPESNGTATFHFDDENAKHAAVCEFLFPEETDWTNSVSTSDTSTTPLATTSRNCTAVTDTDLCEEESTSLQSTFTTLPSTDATTDSQTLTHSMTQNISTGGDNSSGDGKNVVPTTDISYDNVSETITSSTENVITETTSSSLSSRTVSETTESYSESSDVSTNTSAETTTQSTTPYTTESTTQSTTAYTTESTTQSTTQYTTEFTTDSTTTSPLLSSSTTSMKITTESDTGTTKGLNSVGCKERNESGIRWPTTPPGEIANQSCPAGMTGYAQWKCDEKTLTFVPKKPSIHNCRHIWIDNLEDEIKADGDAVEISYKLANKTKNNTLSHGDIAAVVELAENLMKLFSKQKHETQISNEDSRVSDMTYDFTKSFVATYSNVLQSEHSNAWNDLPECCIDYTWNVWNIRQRFVASKILRHTETVGQELSCIKMTEDNVQYTVLEDNINLQTFMFNSSEKRSRPYVFPRLEPEASLSGKIALPAGLTPDLWPSSCPDAKTAVGIIYKNVGQFLKEESEEKTDSNVTSSVLGFTLGNGSAESIKLPGGLRVTILLEHTTPVNRRTARYKVARCVFWNFSRRSMQNTTAWSVERRADTFCLRLYPFPVWWKVTYYQEDIPFRLVSAAISRGSFGNWDDSGCYVIQTNFSHTICSCDHLTNFAILMDVKNNVGGKDIVLELMTYICCGLSAVALTVTLLCLVGIRSMHCRRNTITSNLCAALLVMNVIVVFGLDRTENEILCAVLAGFLQYSVLSVFCWMLLEAYQLYQMVILVFCSSTQISMVYFYLFGYGVPLVIVGTSAGIRHEDYGGPDVCWLSNENGLLWSFVGPACVIILVNIIVFVMTIKSASSVKIRKEQKTIEKVKSWVKGSFSILCLLGITWLIGLLYMVESFYFAAYIFIALNGLQGVFIFIFHVLLNEKTGSFFRRIFKTKMIVRQTTKSTVLNGISSSERRRTQIRNGTTEHVEVRRNCSSSEQNSRRNSASSNGVPSIAGHVISNSQDTRGSLHHLSRANGAKKSDHSNGLRINSVPSGFSKDIPHSRVGGVVRQLKKAQHKNGE